MEEKKKQRGESEQECLNAVRKILSTKECWAYIGDDLEIFNNIRNAKPNENLNKFPDFVFDGGFIEHFEVTSSEQTKNGFVYKLDEIDFNKDKDLKIKEWEEDCKKQKFNPNTIITKELNFNFDKGSYDYYVASFKKNFEKHIESLKKYNGDKNKGVFLIDGKNANLHIEMKPPIIFYRLIYDKDILQYIYQFKDCLEYVIFTSIERLDIIRISLIPKILERIPKDIKFKAGRISSHTILARFDLKI